MKNIWASYQNDSGSLKRSEPHLKIFQVIILHSSHLRVEFTSTEQGQFQGPAMSGDKQKAEAGKLDTQLSSYIIT